MKTRGARKLKRSSLIWLEQFADKIPQPFEVTYDTDSFTFYVRLRLQSEQAISEDALTETFSEVIPLFIRRQLEQMRIEVENMLQSISGVNTLPQTLVTRDQWEKYMGNKKK